MVDFIQSQEHRSYDDPAKVRALTRSVLWKLDIHVLPPLAFVCPTLDPVNEFLDSVLSQLWLANFIDRTNVGNAALVVLNVNVPTSY